MEDDTRRRRSSAVLNRGGGSGARGPIAAIGSSAGGTAALQELLSGFPERAGLSLVILQHFPPAEPSQLVQILGRCTPAPVGTALDGLAPEPGCIYVALPGRELRLENGLFRNRRAPAVARLAGIDSIDGFLESLAADQGPSAIAVILSGTGGDGSAGAVAIKREGGLVLVQDPKTALFDGMPRAAIARGVVAQALAPRALAARLLACVPAPRIPGAGDGDASIAAGLRLQVEALQRELAASREEVRTLEDELHSTHEQISLGNADLEELQLQLLASIQDLDEQRSLLSSGAVMALHLDAALRVRWFTSAIRAVFALMLTDRGRNIMDFDQKFDDANFISDVRQVLRDGDPLEAEVFDFTGRCFLRRICLHRSNRGVPGGAVVTFTDISDRSAADTQSHATT